MWEAASGQCVYTQTQLPGPGLELTHCSLVRAAGLLLSVTADHNLLLYEACSLQLQKQVTICPCPAQVEGVSRLLIKDLAYVILFFLFFFSCHSRPSQFAGYSEEVLDVRFLGPKDSHIIVASNSPCLKVFELQTSACQILHGHTGK